MKEPTMLRYGYLQFLRAAREYRALRRQEMELRVRVGLQRKILALYRDVLKIPDDEGAR